MIKSKIKIILNILMLLSSIFIISSCDNDIDDVTCDECYENKIIGEWILNTENIYHSQECTNEMINMNGEVEYSNIIIEFLENGEFIYMDNQENMECNGAYFLEDNCEINILFEECYDDIFLTFISSEFEGGPLDVCFSDDVDEVIFGITIDLHAEDSGFPEGCVYTYSVELSKD